MLLRARDCFNQTQSRRRLFLRRALTLRVDVSFSNLIYRYNLPFAPHAAHKRRVYSLPTASLSRLSSRTTAASASGFTPRSISAIKTASCSRSTPQSSSFATSYALSSVSRAASAISPRTLERARCDASAGSREAQQLSHFQTRRDAAMDD